MSGNPFLDGAALAVSLFDAMLLCWLGLTVWLTSEQRSSGILLTTVGLALGAVFFIFHSIILALSDNIANPWLNLWWRVGWFPVVLSPFLWYLVVLWYAGYWEGASKLRLRQRYALAAVGVIAMGMFVLLFFEGSLPSFLQVTQLNYTVRIAAGGIPLLVLAFPPYILSCLGLALDALLHPGPSRRPMGDQARLRARPWLLISSLILLGVSILVSAVLAEMAALLRSTDMAGAFERFVRLITMYDLWIAGLIGLAVLFLGQSLVSYEIFTGKSLPRQGLRRTYRNTVLVFAGMSAAVSAVYQMRLSPIYGLLLALLISVGSFALLNWRTYAEREWTMRQLRPFAAGPRLFEQMAGTVPERKDKQVLPTSFRALVEDVLDARQAALVALGPLAPLAGEPLVYPPGANVDLIFLGDLRPQLSRPEQMALSLDPQRYGGFAWAVPLWSARGLVGVLLLGDKNGRSFYTQEEIEIARASGERQVDLLASAEIMRRLAALQRDQMVAGQVIDRRTRRVLHDEVLPALHTSLLQLDGAAGAVEEVSQVKEQLSAAHKRIAALLRDLPSAPAPEVTRLGLLEALRVMATEELAAAFDRVEWSADTWAGPAASGLTSLQAEVLYYAAREAVRNAARHARGAQPLLLKITAGSQEGFQLVIEDNGTGIDSSQTRPEQGGGQGLVLHSTLMAVVGGAMAVESRPGAFTRVTLQMG